MAFSDWLDARDADVLASAWAALAATPVDVGTADARISVHGAAQLAASYLGCPLESVAWLASPADQMPAPSFHVTRTAPRSYLEDGHDLRQDTYEDLTIREVVDGARGLQLVTLDYRYDDGTREGGGGTRVVVRLFDRAAQTGASIGIGARTVSTIGTIDLSALDLFDLSGSFPCTSELVGVVAELAGVVGRGPYTIDVEPNGRAIVHGLPWGHRLHLWGGDAYVSAELRLPLAVGQAVLARLGQGCR